MRRLSEDFRENVKQVLDKKAWSQADLATAMGVTPGFVSQLLTGHREPGIVVLGKVADALQVPPCRLVKKNSAQPV